MGKSKFNDVQILTVWLKIAQEEGCNISGKSIAAGAPLGNAILRFYRLARRR